MVISFQNNVRNYRTEVHEQASNLQNQDQKTTKQLFCLRFVLFLFTYMLSILSPNLKITKSHQLVGDVQILFSKNEINGN